MRLLLDTSVVIRIGGAGEPLRPALRAGILRAEAIFLTPLSRVEIIQKVAIGKLELPTDEPTFWQETVDLLRAEELPFTAAHAAHLAAMTSRHKDPFDRMILAQALAEDLTVATTDAVFAEYGVRLLGA